MRSVSYCGDGLVELREVPRPSAGAGDALVRIEVSALCGSERSALAAGMSGNAGHEAVGIVTDINGAGQIRVGDRVGISALVGCGSCRQCLECDEVACASGVSMQLGMHAEFVATPVHALRPLPRELDPVVAVLLAGDTIGVAYRALRRVPQPVSASVAVIGLGAIGLGHVLARSRAGANVIGIDPAESRRALAMKLGATAVASSFDEVSAASDIVIEATGVPACIDAAFRLVTHGGIVLQSGECAQVQLHPSRDVVHRETSYVGSWYFASRDLAAALEAESQDPRADLLATDVFAAGEADAAFETFAKGVGGKVLLRWDQQR